MGSTPTHFSTKATHSYLFFNQNDTLLPTFQEKRPTTTYFLTKTSLSQPFLMENDPLLPSFNKNNPMPPIFQQIRPSLLIFQQKRSTPTILILFSTDLPPKQLVFTSFPTITDFPSPLTWKTSSLNIRLQRKREKHISAKIKYIRQYYYTWNMQGNISRNNKKYMYLKMR